MKRCPTTKNIVAATAAWVLLTALLAASVFGQSNAAQDQDVVFKALADELQRSMTLRLEDLDQPYFIQYTVDDTTNTISAIITVTMRWLVTVKK